MSEENDSPSVVNALETVKLLGNAPKAVPSELVVEVLKILPAYYRASQLDTEMQGLKSNSRWRSYEMRLWELSEYVRRYLRMNRNIRGRCDILDLIASITADRSLGKGRQNFILVLGQYGGEAYADVLGALLSDPDVFGHAVKALTRMKTPNYIERIKAILSESRVGWIRAAAKKYLMTVQS